MSFEAFFRGPKPLTTLKSPLLLLAERLLQHFLRTKAGGCVRNPEAEESRS